MLSIYFQKDGNVNVVVNGIVTERLHVECAGSNDWRELVPLLLNAPQQTEQPSRAWAPWVEMGWGED